MSTVLAIDPGREKCGLAVVDRTGVLYQGIISPAEVPETAGALISEHHPDVVIIGDGTNSGAVADMMRSSAKEVPTELVNERFSTQRARKRFFEDNPPKGLLRLVPRGLLTPHRPYDDYVATILAEDYLHTLPDPEKPA